MLKTTHDGKKIEVRFFHKEREPDWIEAHTGICVDDNRRCSMAIVSIKGTDIQETRGISVCNPLDNFCRATGRKRALRYALDPLEKNIRCAVWAEYKAQMGF